MIGDIEVLVDYQAAKVVAQRTQIVEVPLKLLSFCTTRLDSIFLRQFYNLLSIALVNLDEINFGCLLRFLLLLRVVLD